MSNSLFNAFGAPQDEFSQIIAQINEFKNNFKGDPKEEVEKMMKSGQLTQEEFNRYAQMANRIAGMLK